MSQKIAISFDVFDEKVINKMAENRQVSRSEIVRKIVSDWIESNPQILSLNYQVSLEDVYREIREEAQGVTPKKALTERDKEIIERLSEIFSIAEEIRIEEIADHLGINEETVKNIIFAHGKEIKKKGLDLSYKKGVLINNV